MTRVRPIVGMVGGGQLARMTHQAAVSLDVELRVLAADPETDPANVAASIVAGRPDAAGLSLLAGQVDVMTFDHEGVDPEVIDTLTARGHRVRPGGETLRYAVDKAAQRRHLEESGLPVPRFAVLSSSDDAAPLGNAWGWPLVLKTPTGGYDGRGVWIVADADAAAGVLGQVGRPLLTEEAVDIATELAVIVARRPGGEMVTYPVVETVQRDGICHEAIAPARVTPAVRARAVVVAHAVAEAVDAVGILAVELFVTPGGDVLVNEIAARPHNSGHLTIEGSITSQFENHLRAVLDWPLGSTDLVSPCAVMANVLAADHTTDTHRALPAALAAGPVHVHLYGKEPRPGRKIGHVTVLGEAVEPALAQASAGARQLGAPSPIVRPTPQVEVP